MGDELQGLRRAVESNTPPNGTCDAAHDSSVRSGGQGQVVAARPVAIHDRVQRPRAPGLRPTVARVASARSGPSSRSPSPTPSADTAADRDRRRRPARATPPTRTRAVGFRLAARARTPERPEPIASLAERTARTQGSPPIVTCPGSHRAGPARAGARPAASSRGRDRPTIMTSAMRAGRLAIAPASDSKRPPHDHHARGHRRDPQHVGLSSTTSRRATVSSGRATAGARRRSARPAPGRARAPLLSTMSRRSAKRSRVSVTIHGHTPRPRWPSRLRIVPSTTTGSCASSAASNRTSSSTAATTVPTDAKVALAARSCRAAMVAGQRRTAGHEPRAPRGRSATARPSRAALAHPMELEQIRRSA